MICMFPLLSVYFFCFLSSFAYNFLFFFFPLFLFSSRYTDTVQHAGVAYAVDGHHGQPYEHQQSDSNNNSSRYQQQQQHRPGEYNNDPYHGQEEEVERQGEVNHGEFVWSALLELFWFSRVV